jgi:hypothetical protein
MNDLSSKAARQPFTQATSSGCFAGTITTNKSDQLAAVS